jgi:hypothetical protein
MLIATGALGVLLGLRYRVTAVLVASPVVAIAGAAVAIATGSSAFVAVALSWGAIGVLQGGYLAGLLIAYAVCRLRGRHGGEPML